MFEKGVNLAERENVTKKATKKRADLLLFERGLAESREKAQALIMAGLVDYPGGKVAKPGDLIQADVPLKLKGKLPYVGRGGIKLAHAIDRFALEVRDLVALDVGASTGGFTDCMLQRGARRVYAVDVGHGQLDYGLRMDSRVVVMEGVNAHYPFSLPPQDPGAAGDEKVGVATVDVSFISVTKVIPQVSMHLESDGHLIVLVKPQFEARREKVGRGGIIKDPAVHAEVLGRVIVWAVGAGLRLRDLTPSPILGDAGNREFCLLLQKQRVETNAS